MKKQCISKDWFLRTWKDKEYRKVDLPNDYSVGVERDPEAAGGAANGFFVDGPGRYVKYMEFDEVPQHYILDVDGAYMLTEIEVNEELAAFHPHGYTPYLADITEWIRPGATNKLAINTNPLQPSTRWYSGAGVYRDVFLWTGGDIRIEPWDLFVTTPEVSDTEATVQASVVITADVEDKVQIKAEIQDADENTVAETVLETAVEKGKTSLILKLKVKEPKLWDLDTPNLYKIFVKILKEDTMLDEAEARFGIRTISADAVNGFMLNGKSIKLRGGCIHHDHGVLGAASYPAAEARKIRNLQQAGFNAVRIAHNPPSLALLEVCDEMGMLMMDEAFDMWNISKRTTDYHLWFADWCERDISYMVRRDRNHPCVISYSIGNEILERDGRSHGYEWAAKLASYIREHDTTRFVTSGVCGLWGKRESIDPPAYCEQIRDPKFNNMTNEYWQTVTEKYMEPLDIVGYNYRYTTYQEDHERYPNRVIWGSETHAVHFYESWQEVKNNPYVIGDFTWTAYDNLGEAGTGRYAWAREGVIKGISLAEYPWRTCFQGDLDLCGYRRPQSYFREAVWLDDTEPHMFTTHPEHYGESFTGTEWHWYDVLDTWTFDEKYLGRPVQCEVYTEADRVEWFLNGEKVGECVPEGAVAYMDIPYEPGCVEAICYEEGKEPKKAVLKTVGKANGISINPEQYSIAADNRDLAFFRIQIEDREGNRVPNADMQISCTVTGGELIGIYSGDPKNEDAYTGNVCHVFEGRALAVVKTAEAGSVQIAVYGKDLAGATCTIYAE